jgi:hypothetical protein
VERVKLEEERVQLEEERVQLLAVVNTIMNQNFYQRFFYLPTDAQKNCFKGILKFTLKQLLHVSAQSPSSRRALVEFAKFIVFKIIH